MSYCFDINLNSLSFNYNGIIVYEIWKNIQEYEGIYMISSFGRVKSLKRQVFCGGRYATRKERILKAQKNKFGYCKVILQKNKNKKTKLVHRLVADAFIENPNNKPEVNHKDGVKDNCLHYNLEWVTDKENSMHAVRTGLAPHSIGETHKNSKLKEKDVLEIRRNWDGKHFYKYPNIAKKYGITESSLAKILKRETWKHI